MPKSESKKVFRTVISEQIKEQLMEEIFRHKYAPGERLVESALAKELNVSQTSVREALRSLVAMGFLESEPFKGITVRSLSRQDLWEVYTVRAALESLAAFHAAERITDEQIAELEEICEEMIEAAKAGDAHQRTMLNIEFHKALIRASGLKLILKLFDNLQFGSWSLMKGTFTSMDAVEIALRHRKLIEALKTGDPERASRAVREHIVEGSMSILESVEQTNSADTATETDKKD
jgi:DNA-binding GntR family transcriptional regulator